MRKLAPFRVGSLFCWSGILVPLVPPEERDFALPHRWTRRHQQQGGLQLELPDSPIWNNGSFASVKLQAQLMKPKDGWRALTGPSLFIVRLVILRLGAEQGSGAFA